jgi:hypothetical protein
LLRDRLPERYKTADLDKLKLIVDKLELHTENEKLHGAMTARDMVYKLLATRSGQGRAS